MNVFVTLGFAAGRPSALVVQPELHAPAPHLHDQVVEDRQVLLRQVPGLQVGLHGVRPEVRRNRKDPDVLRTHGVHVPKLPEQRLPLQDVVPEAEVARPVDLVPASVSSRSSPGPAVPDADRAPAEITGCRGPVLGDLDQRLCAVVAAFLPNASSPAANLLDHTHAVEHVEHQAIAWYALDSQVFLAHPRGQPARRPRSPGGRGICTSARWRATDNPGAMPFTSASRIASAGSSRRSSLPRTCGINAVFSLAWA